MFNEKRIVQAELRQLALEAKLEAQAKEFRQDSANVAKSLANLSLDLFLVGILAAAAIGLALGNRRALLSLLGAQGS